VVRAACAADRGPACARHSAGGGPVAGSSLERRGAAAGPPDPAPRSAPPAGERVRRRPSGARKDGPRPKSAPQAPHRSDDSGPLPPRSPPWRARPQVQDRPPPSSGLAELHSSSRTFDAFVSWRSRQTRLSPKTLNEYLNAASVLLNWMKRQGRIAENPLLTIQPSDTRGRTERKRAFSEEEFERLLRVARQHRLIYLTAAYTGLRLGELRQLVWGDLGSCGAARCQAAARSDEETVARTPTTAACARTRDRSPT
jgi:hypothetical protein